jgi:hypothetical protein
VKGDVLTTNYMVNWRSPRSQAEIQKPWRSPTRFNDITQLNPKWHNVYTAIISHKSLESYACLTSAGQSDDLGHQRPPHVLLSQLNILKTLPHRTAGQDTSSRLTADIRPIPTWFSLPRPQYPSPYLVQSYAFSHSYSFYPAMLFNSRLCDPSKLHCIHHLCPHPPYRHTFNKGTRATSQKRQI